MTFTEVVLNGTAITMCDKSSKIHSLWNYMNSQVRPMMGFWAIFLSRGQLILTRYHWSPASSWTLKDTTTVTLKIKQSGLIWQSVGWHTDQDLSMQWTSKNITIPQPVRNNCHIDSGKKGYHSFLPFSLHNVLWLLAQAHWLHTCLGKMSSTSIPYILIKQTKSADIEG